MLWAPDLKLESFTCTGLFSWVHSFFSVRSQKQEQVADVMEPGI